MAQINTARSSEIRHDGPRNVLIIGTSSGYGLAARITAAFGFGAATLGVFMEKPAKRKKTASAGWYNSAAFHSHAEKHGLKCRSINGDAFSQAVREKTVETIRQHFDGNIDLVIYSLAAPKRRLPGGDAPIHAVIKPVQTPFSGTTINMDTGKLAAVSLPPASQEEIDHTTAIMGGDNWVSWIETLANAHVLSDNARTLAFSYIGPECTWPIYRHGTIGLAKQHLEKTAQELNVRMNRPHFARIAMLKSIVTQASAAIPVIPLYLSLVFKVMKEKGLHESAIEQQWRLFHHYLYPATNRAIPEGPFRLDDRELCDTVQKACNQAWSTLTEANLATVTDLTGYRHDFLALFGFDRDDVDYNQAVDPHVSFECNTV